MPHSVSFFGHHRWNSSANRSTSYANRPTALAAHSSTDEKFGFTRNSQFRFGFELSNLTRESYQAAVAWL